MSLMNFSLQVITVLAVLITTGCNKEFEAKKADEISLDSVITAYFIKTNISDFEREPESGIFYYPTQTANPANRALSDGRVIYFRYELSVFNLSDTVIGTPFVSMLLQTQSIVAAHGVNAIYPVGLDIVLSESDIHEQDTLNMLLPSDFAFGSFSLSSNVPANSAIHVKIVLDSIKTGNEVRASQIQRINQYVIASNLNDTAKFKGSFVISMLGGGARYKLLGDTLLTSNPINGDLLNIVYTLRDLDSVVLDNQYAITPFEFVLNDQPIAEFIEAGLKLMRNGETAVVIASSDVAYKESVCVLPDLSLRNTFEPYFDHLIDDGIVPDYVLRVKPYTPLIVQTRLISIN